MAGCHSTAALREHMSLRAIAIFLVQAKKLVSVEDAPCDPLRREDKYPSKLMVLGFMEN